MLTGFQWPQNCETIPKKCFFGSPIKRISGIKNVKYIEKWAFESTKITSFTWPSSCYEIPEKCFERSDIKEIKNIEHVNKIGDSAFAHCRFREFTVPIGVRGIPQGLLFQNKDLEIVNLHDGICTIGKGAFYGATQIKCLDLSSAIIQTIEDAAFGEIPKDKITFPFYTSEDDIQRATDSDSYYFP